MIIYRDFAIITIKKIICTFIMFEKNPIVTVIGLNPLWNDIPIHERIGYSSR